MKHGTRMIWGCSKVGQRVVLVWVGGFHTVDGPANLVGGWTNQSGPNKVGQRVVLVWGVWLSGWWVGGRWMDQPTNQKDGPTNQATKVGQRVVVVWVVV